MMSYIAIVVAWGAWTAVHHPNAARNNRAALVALNFAQQTGVESFRLLQQPQQEFGKPRNQVTCRRNQDKWECKRKRVADTTQVCVICGQGASVAVQKANRAQSMRTYREVECKIIEPWENSTDHAIIQEKQAEFKRKNAARKAKAVALQTQKMEKCAVDFCVGNFAGFTLSKWFCRTSGSSRCVCTHDDAARSAARVASKNRGVQYLSKDCTKLWTRDRRDEENRAAKANRAKAARAQRLKAKQDAEAERIAKRRLKKLREGVLEVDWKQVVCANEQDVEWQYSNTCPRMQRGPTSGTWQIGGNQKHVQKWFCAFNSECYEGRPCEGVCPCLEAEANASAAAASALKFPQFPGRWTNCRRFPDSTGKGVEPPEKYREKIVQKAASIASALDSINRPSEALVKARKIQQKASDGLHKILMIKNVPENDVRPAVEAVKIDTIGKSKDILDKVVDLSVGLPASSGELTDLVNSKADRLIEDSAGLGDKLTRDLKSSRDRVKVAQKVDIVSTEIQHHLEDSIDAVSRVVLMDTLEPVRVVADLLEKSSESIKDVEVITEPSHDVVDIVQKKIAKIQEHLEDIVDVAEDDALRGKPVREIKDKASSDVREQLIAAEDIGREIHKKIVVPHIKEKEELERLTDGSGEDVEDISHITDTIDEAEQVFRDVEAAKQLLKITLEPDLSDGINGLEDARIITPLVKQPRACSTSAPSKLLVKEVQKNVPDHEIINGIYQITTSFTPIRGCPVYKREGHDKFLYYKEKSGDWRIGDWTSGELQDLDPEDCNVHSTLMEEATTPTKPEVWFQKKRKRSSMTWLKIEVVHDPEARSLPVQRFVPKDVVKPPARNASDKRVPLRPVVEKAPVEPVETPPCEWSRHTMCENVKRFIAMAKQSERYKYTAPTDTCDKMLDSRTAGCFTCCARAFAFVYLQKGEGSSKWCPAAAKDSPCPVF